MEYQKGRYTQRMLSQRQSKFKLKILSFLVLMLSACLTNAQSKVTTINIKASIYCDHCKQCGSCGSRLENAVYSLKGIKRVDVDEKSKTVNVVYNPKKTTPQQIRQAIAKVGFDADDVKADPTAYTKLDECCKKQ
ncbi:MAG: heavy-metal-associated domain-containing protein [Flavipsychrobacter sp.]|nr:heavy-metal-associated domain-containing protein [Flavipsychrobacter sp.]